MGNNTFAELASAGSAQGNDSETLALRVIAFERALSEIAASSCCSACRDAARLALARDGLAASSARCIALKVLLQAADTVAIALDQTIKAGRVIEIAKLRESAMEIRVATEALIGLN